VQLIAKIHYNRGVACLRAGDFAEGMRLTRESLTLDPQDQVAHGNLLAGLNNWALRLCERAEYARAAELLDELRKLDPAYPTLQENQAHLYRAWAKQRLSGG
jgi:Flp pilus assembly protein TadD